MWRTNTNRCNAWMRVHTIIISLCENITVVGTFPIDRSQWRQLFWQTKTTIGKIRVSFIFEYCINNTAYGIHTSNYVNKTDLMLKAQAHPTNRQAFSFYSEVDMHSHLIQKQTCIYFTHSSGTMMC